MKLLAVFLFCVAFQIVYSVNLTTGLQKCPIELPFLQIKLDKSRRFFFKASYQLMVLISPCSQVVADLKTNQLNIFYKSGGSFLLPLAESPQDITQLYYKGPWVIYVKCEYPDWNIIMVIGNNLGSTSEVETRQFIREGLNFSEQLVKDFTFVDGICKDVIEDIHENDPIWTIVLYLLIGVSIFTFTVGIILYKFF